MRRRHGPAGLGGLLLAAPVATWLLVGDLSEPGGYPRIVEPPALGQRGAQGRAVVTVAVLVGGGVVAIVAWRQGQLDGPAPLPTRA